MKNIDDQIKKSVADNFNDLLEIRRHIHMHPELSFEEAETAKFISERLSQFGIDHKINVGGHGIVGLIKEKILQKKQ